MSKCPILSTYCEVHDFTHGAEAEELRKGIEWVLQNTADYDEMSEALNALLDRVDARDSLAWIEARDAMNAELENDH